jgi:hypothetical protein
MREVTDKEQNIAKHLVDSLATFPIGTEISLRVLGEATYEKLCSEGKQNEPWMQDLNDVILNFDAWWNIIEPFDECVKKDGRFRLDYTKTEGLCLGLPYNIPFVLLKKGQSIHAKESRAAKQFASEHDLYGIMFICYWEGEWAFAITHDPQVLVDPAFPPTYIMVDEELKARFSTQKEGEQIYDFKPVYPW